MHEPQYIYHTKQRTVVRKHQHRFYFHLRAIMFINNIYVKFQWKIITKNSIIMYYKFITHIFSDKYYN